MTEKGKTAGGDTYKWPGKIKLEGIQQNSLYANRKLLPELEFDKRFNENCTIHDHMYISYLN